MEDPSDELSYELDDFEAFESPLPSMPKKDASKSSNSLNINSEQGEEYPDSKPTSMVLDANKSVTEEYQDDFSSPIASSSIIIPQKGSALDDADDAPSAASGKGLLSTTSNQYEDDFLQEKSSVLLGEKNKDAEIQENQSKSIIDYDNDDFDVDFESPVKTLAPSITATTDVPKENNDQATSDHLEPLSNQKPVIDTLITVSSFNDSQSQLEVSASTQQTALFSPPPSSSTKRVFSVAPPPQLPVFNLDSPSGSIDSVEQTLSVIDEQQGSTTTTGNDSRSQMKESNTGDDGSQIAKEKKKKETKKIPKQSSSKKIKTEKEKLEELLHDSSLLLGSTGNDSIDYFDMADDGDLFLHDEEIVTEEKKTEDLLLANYSDFVRKSSKMLINKNGSDHDILSSLHKSASNANVPTITEDDGDEGTAIVEEKEETPQVNKKEEKAFPFTEEETEYGTDTYTNESETDNDYHQLEQWKAASSETSASSPPSQLKNFLAEDGMERVKRLSASFMTNVFSTAIADEMKKSFSINNTTNSNHTTADDATTDLQDLFQDNNDLLTSVVMEPSSFKKLDNIKNKNENAVSEDDGEEFLYPPDYELQTSDKPVTASLLKPPLSSSTLSAPILPPPTTSSSSSSSKPGDANTSTVPVKPNKITLDSLQKYVGPSPASGSSSASSKNNKNSHNNNNNNNRKTSSTVNQLRTVIEDTRKGKIPNTSNNRSHSASASDILLRKQHQQHHAADGAASSSTTTRPTTAPSATSATSVAVQRNQLTKEELAELKMREFIKSKPNNPLRFDSKQCRIVLIDICIHRKPFSVCSSLFCKEAYKKWQWMKLIRAKTALATELLENAHCLWQGKLESSLEDSLETLEREQAVEYVTIKKKLLEKSTNDKRLIKVLNWMKKNGLDANEHLQLVYHENEVDGGEDEENESEGEMYTNEHYKFLQKQYDIRKVFNFNRKKAILDHLKYEHLRQSEHLKLSIG
jgi:hypothetical protein